MPLIGGVRTNSLTAGRVALPLAECGVSVHGIELSPYLAERLRAKPASETVPVTIGRHDHDPRSGQLHAGVPGANTIVNVTTQEEQLAVFANAAAHLKHGGCFVVELVVPQLHHVPPGDTARVFRLDPDHVGIESFGDLAGQIARSHHWMHVRGRLVRHSAPYRYVWPAELSSFGELAPSAVHLGQHQPDRGIREVAVTRPDMPPSRGRGDVRAGTAAVNEAVT